MTVGIVDLEGEGEDEGRVFVYVSVNFQAFSHLLDVLHVDPPAHTQKSTTKSHREECAQTQ